MKVALSKAMGLGLKILSIFGTTKDLVGVIVAPPKSEYGLDEFVKLSYFVARCGLLIGGITSMGFSYVISYSIAKALLSPALAQVAAFIAMAACFLVFDGLLGVAWPLWLQLQSSGRTRFKNRKQEGGLMLFFAGVLLFILCASIAFGSIAFSFNSSEFPVAMAMAAEVEEKAPTKNKVETKEVLEFAATFDDELKNAKEEDDRQYILLQKKGGKNVAAAIKKYRTRSQKTFKDRTNRARRDSTNLVDGRESRYQQALRNKNHAVEKYQKSISSAQEYEHSHSKNLKAIFDKKAETSIFVLKMLGCSGTVLFLLITTVIIILTTALSHSNKEKARRKSDQFIRTANNQGVTGSWNKNWNKLEQSGTFWNKSHRPRTFWNKFWRK